MISVVSTVALSAARLPKETKVLAGVLTGEIENSKWQTTATLDFYTVKGIMENLFAEKDGGITINDCVDISRYLDPILENEDFIEGEYRLQVSSPGLDRTLKKEKDFIRYFGFADDSCPNL